MNFFERFLGDRRGNTMLALAGMLPLVIGSVGAAVDYGNLILVQSHLQAAADGAALTGARELRVASARDEAVKAVAESYARANASDVPALAFEAAVAPSRQRFSVTLDTTVPGYLPVSLSPFSSRVKVQAEAQVMGGEPICLMGLDTAATDTVLVDRARVTAPACGVYSNSSSPSGMVLSGSGGIRALKVCSSGGVRLSGGSAQPAAKTDCPVSPDPLAGRVGPTVGACTFKNHVAIGVAVLQPGVYCGGLVIASGTIATLLPGDFIIKDGPLVVKDLAAVTGVASGFYFTGPGATFDIAPTTAINLVAPVTGPLAGMLFFEDRANPPATHKMNSRTAPVMLGTFYLPKSRLEIGPPGGAGLLTRTIGALSAWTIVVAGQVQISDGLNLTLNTDYSATKVPVPEGVGGGQISLVR